MASSLHFGKISLHFPKLQGETGSDWTASTTTHSDTNRRFLVSDEKPRMMGGDVTVASEAGKGSVFAVRLPVGLEKSAAV